MPRSEHFSSPLERLISLADMAEEGHILKDALPYLEELVELRKLQVRWDKRCFHGDCNGEMVGAHIAPVCITYCPEHRALAEKINKQALPEPREARPVTMELKCPTCGQQHIDEGEWVWRKHSTHRCVKGPCGPGCGNEWKPYQYHTVGVVVG